MILKKSFKEMPGPILVLFFLFLLIPFASFVFGGSLSGGFGRRPNWGLALFVLAYWLMPLLICYSIAIRHYLFLPFYLLQCALLAVHSFGYTLPSDILLARFVLIGLMIYVGLVFGNKDFLYPFLTRRSRPWRKHPRTQVYLPIQLRSQNENWMCPAILKDCSASGMAITVDELTVGLSRLKKGKRVVAIIQTAGGTSSVPAEIAWISSKSEFRLFGLRALDAPLMSALAMLIPNESKATHGIYAGVLQHKMKNAGFVLWILFILLVFGLPAFAL